MDQHLLQSRPHFEALDGLRGLAALSIVVFHLYEFITPDYTLSPIGHGYLAVDFFFCLSGFVIGYAYDERAIKLGARQFFLNRLIRLHPMVIWGSVIGLLGFIYDPFSNAVTEAGWIKTTAAFLCSLLMLPSPILPGRGGGLFPLNTPAWSLFQEYIINIFYVLVLLKLPKRWLTGFFIVSAIWLSWVAQYRGWIITGWDAPTFYDGFARVSCSFLAGLVVYRFGLIIRHRINFLLIAALLLGVFIFPHRNNDWITEMFIVLFVFPLLLALGAGAMVHGWIKACCVFIGRLSYPLYMTHIWLVWIFGNYLNVAKPDKTSMYTVAAGIFIASCLLGYIALKFYDEPLRAWLTKRLTRRLQAEKVPAGK
ncbi:peptidoglycan/LPS O-acetylase OafA/YrhL [Chitinophaga terrae (ex Kim and Jung 2007)]|uniref:acyltransferase family protein n=1 Tax=Chitinophaga terrae (ex Kim and Jung 2007) TaxID=408074 RepID=UPI00277F9569|nr:acyltransferase [Chitinophaga terrae (ex Kim and Jung 2007)]MDQ0109492.1 peptidoglycan/LPS O-acetylase OafA/YrhL [Chitinophaga terrae (ex Kim and Jung 2007)]